MKKFYLIVALALLAVGTAWGQTTVTAAITNSVRNPTQYSGVDIGDKVNRAFTDAIGTDANGNLNTMAHVNEHITVRIPSGKYSFSTTISYPGEGFGLECDAGTELDYTGSGDAIAMLGSGSGTNAGVDGRGGCLIVGNSTARSGIHSGWSNHVFVRNFRIKGFTNPNVGYGYGILVSGTNAVEIANNTIRENKVGIELTSDPNGAANAVHIQNNAFNGNTQAGVRSEVMHPFVTQFFGIVIRDNSFEAENNEDIYLDWNDTTLVEGNYFEGLSGNHGARITVGVTSNAWATTIRSNYFDINHEIGQTISIGYGSHWEISGNGTYGSAVDEANHCFVNVQNGPNGGSNTYHGGNTNHVVAGHEWCNHNVSFTP